MDSNKLDINYYSVLDVDKKASFSEVHNAYLRAKKTYSLSNPQIFQIFTQKEAIEWLNLVEEAYSVISDSERRQIYDAETCQDLHVKDLPSFSYQKDSSEKNEPVKTNIKSVKKETSLPEPGYARTSLSEYKLDNDFETLIANTEDFSGDFLRQIRRYKKVDIEEFSKKTCIALRYLYAIENDNYSELPAQVFVRGYIVQYCKFFGLDENIVVDSFMQLYNQGRNQSGQR